MSKPDVSHVEVPRHVKKPGAWLRVNTLQELQEALVDGWVLRLPSPSTEAPAPASEPETASELAADAGPVTYDASELADEEPGGPAGDVDEAPQAKRGPGRPKKHA